MSVSSNVVETPIDRIAAWLRSVLAFARALIACPKKVASVIPSSTMLLDELSRLVDRTTPSVVVELGPGTGGTTRALLLRLPKHAKLLAIEIVPEFVEQLRLIDDPRLIIHEGDASRFEQVLREQNLPHPQLVVSGIPFSVMAGQKANKLLRSIHDALAPGGLFVAYQFRDKISQYAAAMFGDPQISFILWNLPPLRLYRWKKEIESKTEMAPFCANCNPETKMEVSPSRCCTASC